MASLENLPNEIVFKIALFLTDKYFPPWSDSYLEISRPTALLRTCKRFYDLLYPLMYRNVNVLSLGLHGHYDAWSSLILDREKAKLVRAVDHTLLFWRQSLADGLGSCAIEALNETATRMFPTNSNLAERWSVSISPRYRDHLAILTLARLPNLRHLQFLSTDDGTWARLHDVVMHANKIPLLNPSDGPFSKLTTLSFYWRQHGRSRWTSALAMVVEWPLPALRSISGRYDCDCAYFSSRDVPSQTKCLKARSSAFTEMKLTGCDIHWGFLRQVLRSSRGLRVLDCELGTHASDGAELDNEEVRTSLSGLEHTLEVLRIHDYPTWRIYHHVRDRCSLMNFSTFKCLRTLSIDSTALLGRTHQYPALFSLVDRLPSSLEFLTIRTRYAPLDQDEVFRMEVAVCELLRWMDKLPDKLPGLRTIHLRFFLNRGVDRHDSNGQRDPFDFNRLTRKQRAHIVTSGFSCPFLH